MNKPPFARKRFGQNFLIDSEVIQQILAVFNPKTSENIVEIGPGRGALTQGLLDRVKHLTAIEIDRDLIAFLNEKFDSTRVTIIGQDALTVDFASLSQNNQKLRIIGNLPYNIATVLLFHLMQYRHQIQDLYFMLQKEVADRIAAKPNTKSYGKLTILLNYFCQSQILFDVPPQAFSPMPKVHSSFIKLIPHENAIHETPYFILLENIVSTAFNQRRKTLQNALHSFLEKEDFLKLNIDPQLRPEQLSFNDYLAITQYLGQK